MKTKTKNFLKSLKRVKTGFCFVSKSLLPEIRKLNCLITPDCYGEQWKRTYYKIRADGKFARKKIIVWESTIITEGEIGKIGDVRMIFK